MAMFGSMGAKRSPFDFKPQVYGTPGIGDGLPGATPMGGVGDFISPETRNILDTAPPAKAGFGARDVVGIIGDALSAMGGGQGVYTQMKLRERDTQQRLQMAQQQRQADMEDWRAKFDYERQFPKAGGSEPDVIQLQRIADDPNQPESVRKAARDRVTSMNDPIVNVSLGGRDFAGPRSLFLGSQGGGDPRISPQPVAQNPAPTVGSGAPHLTIDQMGAFGSMFPKWQQREKVPVLVTSAAEMARVPKGTMVISPDGRRGVKQ